MRCSVRGGRKVHPDAGDRSLPARMRALEDILAHLLGEIERAHASARSAEALAEQNERSLLAVAKAQAVLRGDPPAVVAAGARHAGKAKRDRHGMHLVRGGALGAVAAGGLRWFAQSRAHKAIGSAALLAAAGGTVAAPSLMLGPPSPSPAAVVPSPHHHYRPAASPAPSSSPVTVPPLAAPGRRRHGTSTAASPGPSPVPSATAVASPPAPDPSATATGTPAVLPSTEPTDAGDGDPDPGGNGGGHGRGLLAAVLDVLPLW